MIRPSRKSGRIVSALLFALLLSVQTISFAHAYQHDPTSFQEAACATCVSINQLAAVAVDQTHFPVVRSYRPVLCSYGAVLDTNAVVRAPRQRGPPPAP